MVVKQVFRIHAKYTKYFKITKDAGTGVNIHVLVIFVFCPTKFFFEIKISYFYISIETTMADHGDINIYCNLVIGDFIR